jgi:hypothetical protein
MNALPPGGVSPPAGSPARQADALRTIAARLRRDAACLEALASELLADAGRPAQRLEPARRQLLEAVKEAT